MRDFNPKLCLPNLLSIVSIYNFCCPVPVIVRMLVFLSCIIRHEKPFSHFFVPLLVTLCTYTLGGSIFNNTISFTFSPWANKHRLTMSLSLCSSINDCPEDIQAFVKEVTQDIATEIRSELREVISKVDNVLESTEQLDTSGYNLSTFHQLTSAEEMKNSDAVSASDVAQYLREFSIEMASEVKSEIREMCATVKEFNDHPRRSSPTDLDGLKQCLKAVMGDNVHRRSETVIGNQRPRMEDGCCGDVKPSRSESFPATMAAHMWKNTAGSGNINSNHSDPRAQARYTGAISKLSDSTETASRDSGINMCFGENDSINQSAGVNAR